MRVTALGNAATLVAGRGKRVPLEHGNATEMAGQRPGREQPSHPGADDDSRIPMHVLRRDYVEARRSDCPYRGQYRRVATAADGGFPGQRGCEWRLSHKSAGCHNET